MRIVVLLLTVLATLALTASAQTSGTLSGRIVDASGAVGPGAGRNYTDLAFLQPGVTPYPDHDGGSVVAHGLGMAVNG